MALPFREFANVFAFPIMINALRARESNTLRRSGDDMKPMSLSELLLHNEAMTTSLSSPW
jgi:hypothetical protein